MWKTVIVLNGKRIGKVRKFTEFCMLIEKQLQIADQRSLKLQSELCIFCPRRKYVKLCCPIRSAKNSFLKGHYRYVFLSVSPQFSIEFHISPCRPWSKRNLDWNFRIEVFTFTRETKFVEVSSVLFLACKDCMFFYMKIIILNKW